MTLAKNKVCVEGLHENYYLLGGMKFVEGDSTGGEISPHSLSMENTD